MVEKKRQQRSSDKNRGTKQRRKKMSYRKKVVAFQIGAITLAIFLLLMVGAVILTKVFVGEANNSQTASADVAGDQVGADDDNANLTDLDTVGTGSAEGSQDTTGDGQASAEGNGEDAQEAQSVQPVEEVKITVSMVGDCTIGTDEQFDKSSNFDAFYIVKKDPGYFFQGVRDVFAADDLTVINMEGTLTESDTRQDKTYAFKGDPKYTEILTAGNVDAANLANNHSKDYGEQSYTDTIQYLESAGIATFGYDRTSVLDIKGIKVGLVGIYVLADGMERQQQLIDNIQSVKNQGAQVVIVSFHWGTEKATYPDDIQKTLAHIAVDNGADLVVGHHPHVLQGIEEYNGKNIVYSLGNFCFGGNRNPLDKDTMIFQQTFTFENGELVQDNVKNIIPCSLSSVKEYNDYQPTILEGSESERVLQKIQELSSGLSGN
ncbi:MAG: CapA family protein [Oliverpabstia sp.]|nr:CapA family protein [Lachnospiraceae bacterium]MDY5026037.1 CapA family protein [Oliverpabstia sp.]